MDNLLEKKIYTDLKESSRRQSIWRTVSYEETVVNLLNEQITEVVMC